MLIINFAVVLFLFLLIIINATPFTLHFMYIYTSLVLSLILFNC